MGSLVLHPLNASCALAFMEKVSSVIEDILRRLLNTTRVRMQTLQPGADPLKELEWVEDQLSKELRERGADTSEFDTPNRDRLEHHGLRSVTWRRRKDDGLEVRIGPWKAEIHSVSPSEHILTFKGPDPRPSDRCLPELNDAKYFAILDISKMAQALERLREYL